MQTIFSYAVVVGFFVFHVQSARVQRPNVSQISIAADGNSAAQQHDFSGEVFSIVQDEQFQKLASQRKELDLNLTALNEAAPFKGYPYWEKVRGEPIIRCCCEYLEGTKQKVTDAKCRYLHAFEKNYKYEGPEVQLKQSSNPMRIGEWVCPGNGWHHSDSEEDLAECVESKRKEEELQGALGKQARDLNKRRRSKKDEIATLQALWGCKVLHNVEDEFGTYCLSGEDTFGTYHLTDPRNCLPGNIKCYASACYQCLKEGLSKGKVFARRTGDGFTPDQARMDALERCRVGCK